MVSGETAGEMVICGDTVSPGYYGDEVKTSAVFRNGSNGARCYRTGDRGFYGSDGMLYITGRMDLQIKFHEYQIELEDTRVCSGRGKPTAETSSRTACSARSWSKMDEPDNPGLLVRLPDGAHRLAAPVYVSPTTPSGMHRRRSAAIVPARSAAPAPADLDHLG